MRKKAKACWCLAERVTDSDGRKKINFFLAPSFKTKEEAQEYLDTKARQQPYFADRILEVTYWTPDDTKKRRIPSGKRRSRR